jgi:hypothetical protein
MLPARCAMAYKEWAGICRALELGRQAILLRKGGISEGPGPGEFRPEYPEFWLYPTHVHQNEQGLRDLELASEIELEQVSEINSQTVSLRSIATVEQIGWIDRIDDLAALERFHIWTPETILKRFQYRRPGLWILAVRVYRRSEPFEIPVTPEQLGCKTWVSLGESYPCESMIPALDDSTWENTCGQLKDILDRRRSTIGETETPSV